MLSEYEANVSKESCDSSGFSALCGISGISENSFSGICELCENSFSAFSTNKYVDENADSVFSFTTVSEMETCMELLESNEEYMALGTQKRSSFNSPMLKWKLFLEEFEKEKKNLLNPM